MLDLQKIEASKLHSEVLEFGPVECMECGYDGEIPVQYYLVKSKGAKESDFQYLDKLVKEKTGFETFTEMGSELGDLISVCRCPECESEEIFQDL